MEKELRIVFITPFVRENFFITVKKGAQDACEIMNASFNFIGTKEIDIPEQISLVKKAIDEGVDGIAMSFPDKSAFNEIVKFAADSNVPVVGFNIDTDDSENMRLAGIQQNFIEAGNKVGKNAYDKIKEGSKVLFTLHSENTECLELRLQGEKQILEQKNVQHETIVTDIFPEGSSEIIKRKLLDDESISAIIGTGQADTEGAGIAKKKWFADRDLYIAGFDTSENLLQFISEGIVDFTIDQQPYAQGFYPVLQLCLYIRHGIVPCDMDAGAAVINKSNLEEVVRAQKKGFR